MAEVSKGPLGIIDYNGSKNFVELHQQLKLNKLLNQWFKALKTELTKSYLIRTRRSFKQNRLPGH